MGLNRFSRGRLVAILLVALTLYAGCYRWVPIRSDFAAGKPSKVGLVRIGGEGGQELEDAHVAWPMMAAIQQGEPVTIDLRKTPAERREVSPGGVAAIVLPPVLIVLGLVLAGAAVCSSGCVPGVH